MSNHLPQLVLRGLLYPLQKNTAEFPCRKWKLHPGCVAASKGATIPILQVIPAFPRAMALHPPFPALFFSSARGERNGRGGGRGCCVEVSHCFWGFLHLCICCYCFFMLPSPQFSSSLLYVFSFSLLQLRVAFLSKARTPLYTRLGLSRNRNGTWRAKWSFCS